MVNFAEVVEAAGKLSVEEQETLLEILGRRVSDLKRKLLAIQVDAAQAEFDAGKLSTTTPQQIIDEALR